MMKLLDLVAWKVVQWKCDKAISLVCFHKGYDVISSNKFVTIIIHSFCMLQLPITFNKLKIDHST